MRRDRIEDIKECFENRLERIGQRSFTTLLIVTEIHLRVIAPVEKSEL
jgi:hypothetical protein